MTLEGNVYKVWPTQTVGQNGFRKRGMVVETSGQYPQKVLVEFVQDKTALLDNVAEGEAVVVSINIRGNEVTRDGKTKYFNSIQGWKIDKAPLGAPEPPAQAFETTETTLEVDDDLPF